MSQQWVRRNGSPTPPVNPSGAGGAPGGRLQPMRATVPFQLKQHGSPTRVNNNNGAALRPPSRSGSPTRGNGANGNGVESPPAVSNSRGSPTVSTQTGASPTRGHHHHHHHHHHSHHHHHHHHNNQHHQQPGSPNSASPAIDSSTPGVPSSSSPSPVGRPGWQQRSSPERKSPSSPKGNKPPPPSSSPSSLIRRTSSLDTLAAPYLSGQWPREQGQTAPCMCDKSTQTESAWAEEYAEKKKSSHKRSASWGSNEQLKEIAKLRQQLQRSKHSSRHHRDKDRQSPFHGNHTAINQTSLSKNVLTPMAIPITKSSGSRFRNSVEGLNQEVEIIIKETGEKEEQLMHGECSGLPDVNGNITMSFQHLHPQPQDIPDGHRAPPPLALRSVDTQTPGNDRSNNSSRAQSISPASFITISNDCNEESPCSADDTLADPKDKGIKVFYLEIHPSFFKLTTHITSGHACLVQFNAFLFNSRPKPLQEIPPFYCPDKNKVNFIPKSGSAFCLVSILKPLLPNQEFTFKTTNHSLTVPSGIPSSLVQNFSMASISSSMEQERNSRGTNTLVSPMSLLHPTGQIDEEED
ncbi:protein FAM117B [Pyxicephalus adspersus]|uniref:protein FAM117B n=1 Tax=Pyxicephalus adspersus TaxID=30357 RepID=UPI003B595E2C